MTFSVRFTARAEADLVRLYAFLLETEAGLARAQRALDAIGHALRSLAVSPFSYRKVSRDNPFLRELVIPFGSAGYVAMFEIDNDRTVTILAVRHQREDDYH